MARGGKRPGAGRPSGATTRKTREIADKAAEEGITPLDYMLKVLRDESQETKRRDAMAVAAAPYLHPKLASTELTGSVTISHEDRLSELE